MENNEALVRRSADGVALTPAQLKSQRARNIAIASVIGFIVILFYVVTIVKLGAGVLKGGV